MSLTILGDTIVDLAPDMTFLLPYLAREYGYEDIPPTATADDIATSRCKAVVVVSSTDVYTPYEGTDLDETTPIDTRMPDYVRETRAAETAGTLGLPVAVLRCANIVGTGMTRFTHTIASLIYRGKYAQILGNEAQTSLVHALDVARAVKSVSCKEGIFNLTDGNNHTINDLALAIAHRIDDKRLPVIKPRWARWYYGRRRYERLTTTLTFSAAKFLPLLPFTPIDVTDYLNTHEYTPLDI